MASALGAGAVDAAATGTAWACPVPTAAAGAISFVPAPSWRRTAPRTSQAAGDSAGGLPGADPDKVDHSDTRPVSVTASTGCGGCVVITAATGRDGAGSCATSATPSVELTLIGAETGCRPGDPAPISTAAAGSPIGADPVLKPTLGGASLTAAADCARSAPCDRPIPSAVVDSASGASLCWRSSGVPSAGVPAVRMTAPWAAGCPTAGAAPPSGADRWLGVRAGVAAALA